MRRRSTRAPYRPVSFASRRSSAKRTSRHARAPQVPAPHPAAAPPAPTGCPPRATCHCRHAGRVSSRRREPPSAFPDSCSPGASRPCHARTRPAAPSRPMRNPQANTGVRARRATRTNEVHPVEVDDLKGWRRRLSQRGPVRDGDCDRAVQQQGTEMPPLHAYQDVLARLRRSRTGAACIPWGDRFHFVHMPVSFSEAPRNIVGRPPCRGNVSLRMKSYSMKAQI